MLLGVGLGFWVGLLPGLGGGTTLALMLPFTYTMSPAEAFAFLLGMHSVVATTGDITSVLFGVPGEAASAATVLDGYAMAKKGEAGRALGAALASSLVGALVGAVALALAIPVVRPLVLTFGSPELFMLALVGIAFIAALSSPGGRGMLRGMGGAVAQWMAYGHATQSARTAEERRGFGQGDVRGVLGPGAANNSKEGGALIPTIAFGVPGSTAMAILLGGFYLLGLVPGPDMLTKHLPLTLSMVWTIVLANIITVGASLVFINQLAKLTTIRAHLLIPFIVLLVFIGSYTANNSYGDLVAMLVFGALGYPFVQARRSRRRAGARCAS